MSMSILGSGFSAFGLVAFNIRKVSHHGIIA